MKTRLGLALLALAALPACDIYFGGDDDIPCGGGGAIAAIGARNPETGVCEYFGGGGGCGTWEAQDDRAPLPDWGECPSACESLTEGECFAAERCRAVYTVTPLAVGVPPEFLGCWSIAPSGPAYERVACESLDAYECSRHNDCVGNYAEDVGRDAETGLTPGLRFDSCGSEPVLGCYSDAECPSGWDCTSDTECLPPPGCDASGESDQGCPAVCYGRCVPPAGACDTVDCAPGYHCEEICSGGGGTGTGGSNDSEGAPQPTCEGVCLPDQNFCPIECPPGSQCVEVCADCPAGGDCTGTCSWECIPGGGACAAVDCGPGYQCEERCWPCDPLPDGTGCPPEPFCEPVCVPTGPLTCADVTCAIGEVCELQCSTDPNGGMGDCRPVCVPGGGSTCAAIDCGPGFHCEETCTVPPCPPGEMCPQTCGATCVPNLDPGVCDGPVACDAIPPTCPSGTTPGIRDGCWTGYCIPLTECGVEPPPACEEIADEQACIATGYCRPLYTGTCWLDAAGQWQCSDTRFVRCETAVAPPPMPMP